MFAIGLRIGRTFLLLVLAFALFGPRPLQAEGRVGVGIATDADVADSEQRLRSAAAYLSSDELEGRGVGTEGLNLAAAFIATQFRESGLRIDVADGKPYQEFNHRTRLGLGSTNSVSLEGKDGTKFDLSLGQDYRPLSLSSSARFDLPVVFAGYGITDERIGYDDYAGLDVRGKAVVILRHEPQRNDDASPFDGRQDSRHAPIIRKLHNAVEHGAALVILCTDREELRQRIAETPQADPDTLLRFRIPTRTEDRMIPVIHCRRRVIDQLIGAQLETTLADLEQKIDAELKPVSCALPNWTIRGEVSVMKQGDTLKNVIGLLEGDGTYPDEVIVVGAHYDHLGWGGWGSLAMTATGQIHNGADDNASGTAVLMEIARLLASRGEPLPRSVLFIAFTAEEQGLIGSERYVRDPVVPMRNTVAMVNLDMVGRLRKNELWAYGSGTAPRFSEMLDRVGSAHGLTMRKRVGGYGPSDHSSFYARGVPVLHFFTGFHPQYHRPTDDFETLNIAGMQRIARFSAQIVEELALAPSRPQLQQPPESSLLAGLAQFSGSSEAASTRPAAGTGERAFLGVAVDRVATDPGYRVARVESGSAAESAGLRAGDVIVQIDEREITEPSGLVEELRQRAPGDNIKLSVDRSGIQLVFEVSLGGR